MAASSCRPVVHRVDRVAYLGDAYWKDNLREAQGTKDKLMYILQDRFVFGATFTLSKLSVDGVPSPGCPYILEDKVREVEGVDVSDWKIKRVTAIPVGVYPVRKTWSPRWQHKMWEICEIPGFTGVRPHAGNDDDDTEGCPLTGTACDEENGKVWHSRDARTALYKDMDAAAARGEVILWEVRGLYA